MFESKVNIAIATVCTFVCVARNGCGQLAHGHDRLSQIIENVRDNESLYDDIEVHMVEHYTILNRKPFVKQAGGQIVKENASTDKNVRYVSQHGMFRVDVEGGSVTADEAVSEDVIRMFDGETTRVLEQKQIGNIAKGRIRDMNFIRPHMLLIRSSVAMLPLSTFLQGHEATATVPEHPKDATLVMENSYQGEVTFQGLKCHKVWLTTSVKGKTDWNDRWELWLAEDRNYIPVRMFAYTFRWSPTIPISEASVSKFREIAKGIWFPLAASRTAYDGFAIQRDGRQKPSWRRTYEVTDVSLKPSYDISLFRDLAFPVGTAMYEVENGEIVKSYTQGGTSDPTLGQRGSKWWWLIWANVGVVLAVVVLVYVVRRRRRHAAA